MTYRHLFARASSVLCLAAVVACSGKLESTGTDSPASTPVDDTAREGAGKGKGQGQGLNCPELVPPSPGFCPGGKATPIVNPTSGCTVGFDCTPAATCVAKGGTCVAAATPACPYGYLPEPTTDSCGTNSSVCCIQCPVPPPFVPACDAGMAVMTKDANGCITGFECQVSCPPVAPPLCGPNQTLVTTTGPEGCPSYECKSPPANACEAAGGQCVGLAPVACPSGKWGDANQYPCGQGVGAGCCLP